jgi:hypothetical protein
MAMAINEITGYESMGLYIDHFFDGAISVQT